MTLIRIGTRKSKLALWQADYVAEKLQKHSIETEVVKIETKGDKILNAPFAEIGTKGLFTEELEQRLLDGSVDIAVHSAKDLQSDIGEDLEVLAIGPRELPGDVLVSFKKGISLDEEGLLVGTSSTRRTALLKHYYPHIKHTGARGNLQTRFRKMEEGQYDAMILAYAGVHRMEYNRYIAAELPLDIFTPAAGQGAVALECAVHLDLAKKEMIRAAVNDHISETCVRAERAFLKKLEGGCSIPSFVHAKMHRDQINMSGGIISLDGKTVVRVEKVCSVEESQHTGTLLAQEVLDKGGKEILEEVKRQLNK